MDLPAASAADEEEWGYEPGSTAYWAQRETRRQTRIDVLPGPCYNPLVCGKSF